MNLPKKIFDRKIKLNYENTIITGPKRVGKTFLIFNFLKEFKGSYRYIDFKDYREKNFNFECDLVILENYDFSVTLPKRPTFITSTKNITLPNFKKIELYGLDFEEFFSFDSTTSITHSFDRFLRNGNFPRFFNEEYFKEEFLKETFELLDYNKPLLKLLFANIGEKFTLYQIYQILKKSVKISKDKVYESIKEMINDRVIFEVSKFNSPKSPRKFYSYNFAFKNILTIRKNLQYTFENLILLEIKKPLFYKDNLTFFIPEEERGILVLPFATKEVALEKLKRVEGVRKVEIITISNEFEIDCKRFEVEVMPFIQWRFAQ